LLQAQSLVLRPSGALGGYSVAIEDRAGALLGSCDAQGVLRDHAGQVVLHAPLRWHGRRDQARNAVVEIFDAHGGALGTARLVKWGIGPRARKATVTATDLLGNEVVRIEPADERGEHLALTAAGQPAGSIAVAQVKLGFLRKAHVFTVELAPGGFRPLLVAAALSYDVLLNAVVSASRR
jgi:hypothetical protein